MLKKRGSPGFFCYPAHLRRCWMLEFERALWKSGYNCLAGVDEAGRGALAGPLVAAAVCCHNADGIQAILRHPLIALIRDSKMLSFEQRQRAREVVGDCLGDFCIGVVDVEEIDTWGIAAANRVAMERAASGLSGDPEFLLIDAMTIEHPAHQWGIIDGDATSLLIAAASIVAKVARDEMMSAMQERYGHFTFSRHRGYGTAQHLQELAVHGPCAIHRQSFDPVRRLLGMSL